MLKIAFDPVYAHPLPEGHRFPMLKYELIPQQLLYEGVISEENIFSPLPCSEETVLWTHTHEYYEKLSTQNLSAREQRHIGFPQSGELVHRELVITQGTIDCCHFAMRHGIAMNVAGGTHHAFADRGEGFCLLNDFAVAANYLLRTNDIEQILIVDLDVHQGNGTARIFSNEPRVFTFSMHGAHNYPFHKEKSDLDVPLPDGTGDSEYLGTLQRIFFDLLDRVKPDFAFYLCGVDILNTDKFGKLNVSPDGCLRRDELVLTELHNRKIPVVCAMGGGYSEDIRIIVDAHCRTFKVAKQLLIS